MTTFEQPLGMAEIMGCFASNLHFVIRDMPTNTLQNKLYDNIFFDSRHTDEFILGPQNVVRVDQMWGNFQHTDGAAPNGTPQERQKYLQLKVLDHCPVYAEFRADNGVERLNLGNPR